MDVLAFALLMAAGQLSPGPDMLLILKNTLNHGLRTGMFTIAGICLGIIAHTLLAVTGLSLVLQRTPWLFRLVQSAGALYLLWIAAKLFSGLRWKRRGDRSAERGGTVPPRPGEAFREGLLTNLLNLKVMVLFASILAPFSTPDGTIRPIFPLIMIGQAAVIWPVFAWAMQSRVVRGAFFRYEMLLNGLFGVLLTFFACKLAWQAIK